MRGLCRVDQIFIVAVVGPLRAVFSCSSGRREGCSTPRALRSGTAGSIIRRAHGLRSRHKDTGFHARMAQSTLLIVRVRVGIRGRRVRGLCISKRTSTFSCKPRIRHPRTEHWLQALGRHLSAYHRLLQSWVKKRKKTVTLPIVSLPCTSMH